MRPCGVARSNVIPFSATSDTRRASSSLTRLTDDAVGLFDRAIGRMVRRAEAREEGAVLRDAKAVGDKVCLLVRLGAALIAAKKEKADLDEAVTAAVGWARLAANIAEAERLSRPEKADLNALAGRAWPVLHRLDPIFLAAFRLHAIPAGAPTLRAAEALRDNYAGGGRTWQHINLTGDYLWGVDTGMDLDGFRPLRGSDA